MFEASSVASEDEVARRCWSIPLRILGIYYRHPSRSGSPSRGASAGRRRAHAARLFQHCSFVYKARRAQDKCTRARGRATRAPDLMRVPRSSWRGVATPHITKLELRGAALPLWMLGGQAKRHHRAIAQDDERGDMPGGAEEDTLSATRSCAPLLIIPPPHPPRSMTARQSP